MKYKIGQQYIVSNKFHCTIINTSRLNKWGTIDKNSIIECLQTGLAHLNFKVLTSGQEIRTLRVVVDTSIVPLNKFFRRLYGIT